MMTVFTHIHLYASISKLCPYHTYIAHSVRSFIIIITEVTTGASTSIAQANGMGVLCTITYSVHKQQGKQNYLLMKRVHITASRHAPVCSQQSLFGDKIHYSMLQCYKWKTW